MKKLIFCFYLLIAISELFAALPAHSLNLITTHRKAGMGNAFTAISDDEGLLFSNPAGLGLKKKYLKQNSNEYNNIFDPRNLFYLNLTDTSLKDLNDIINSINISFTENSITDKINDLSSQLLPSAYSASALNFSYISKLNNTSAWGISFFNRFNIDRIAVKLPTLQQILNGDTTKTLQFYLSFESHLSLGFAPFSLSTISPYDFHIGFNLRGFYLYHLQLYNKNSRELEIIESTFDNLFAPNSFTHPFYKDKIFEGIGVAFDIGILWELLFPDKENQINLGITVFDAPGVIFPIISRTANSNHSFFTPNIGVGIAWKIPYKIADFFNNSSLAFDYLRILDPNLDHLSKIHVGFTTDIYNYQSKVVLNTSVGMKYLKPSFHLDLYLYYFRFSYNLDPIRLQFGQEPTSIEFLHKLALSVYL